MLNFAIIGAQKAGSTYVQEQIGAHPQLYTPRGESPFFQDPDYSPERFEDWLARLEAPAAGKKVGVKRPNYLGAPEVPERLRRHAPDCRLIVVLRDPRQRAVSAYFHLMRGRSAPIAPIEEGLPRILNGQLDAEWPNSRSLLDYGLYAQHIERWWSHFPREQLLIQYYEDIRVDPRRIAVDAFEHLGVDADFCPALAGNRPMEGMYSLWRQRINAVANPLLFERFDGGRRIRPRRNPVLRAAGLGLRASDRYVWSKLLPAKAPKLSPGLRARLTDFYADDVRRLAEMTGRDLSAWLQ